MVHLQVGELRVRLEYAEAEVAPKPAEPVAEVEEVAETDTIASPDPAKDKTSSIPSPTILLWVAGISMLIMLILIFIQKHRQQ